MPLQEQASWVCQCEESLVQRLEHDFKVTLQQQSSLDQWASWLDNVVTQVLKQQRQEEPWGELASQSSEGPCLAEVGSVSEEDDIRNGLSASTGRHTHTHTHSLSLSLSLSLSSG